MADGAGAGAHYFALPTGSKLYEFEIEALLGHGGFGITYRATDTLLQETVAIKEFLPNELAIRISDATVRAKSQQAEPDFDAGLKSFLEEARVMARFRHPRIVHVRRFFELHGTGYIVLDYERGKTLSERLSDGPIPDPELRSILSGVLDGLEVIHARAILHRDLKPNNIMLREDGAPVIIDFGAARDFQARHSRSITAIATAGYAPPEQYGVGGQQGPWSDLYALGAIAYRAVSGEPPVDSLRRLRKDPLVPAVVAGAGKYDEALLRTIDWMLKIDEEDRPTSVEQVREALRGGPIAEAGPEISRTVSEKAKGAVSNDGLRTPESGTPSAARPPLRRVGVTAIAISLVVLAGLSAGSYAFYANYQAKQQADLQAKQQAERQTNERQRQLAEQLANAGADQSKLEQFLAACGSDCPDALRTQAQARIDTLKQQQRQAELARQDAERQQLLADELARAGKDQAMLKQFLATCGSTCPVALRTRAQSRIDTNEQEQQRQNEVVHRAVTSTVPAAWGQGADNKQPSNEDQCAEQASQIRELEDKYEHRQPLPGTLTVAVAKYHYNEKYQKCFLLLREEFIVRSKDWHALDFYLQAWNAQEWFEWTEMKERPLYVKPGNELAHSSVTNHNPYFCGLTNEPCKSRQEFDQYVDRYMRD